MARPRWLRGTGTRHTRTPDEVAGIQQIQAYLRSQLGIEIDAETLGAYCEALRAEMDRQIAEAIHSRPSRGYTVEAWTDENQPARGSTVPRATPLPRDGTEAIPADEPCSEDDTMTLEEWTKEADQVISDCERWRDGLEKEGYR